MAMYSSEPNRSIPQDEAGAGWRIMRNGKLHAERESLGEARALVRNTIRIAGNGDTWAILDADGVDAGLAS